METTGIYWIPAFKIPEAHGFEVILVTARYAKTVPSRKTGVTGAGWLPVAALRVRRCSFRREAEVATLRAWKSAKHFTSWLCLAQGNKISEGQLLSSRTRRSSRHAAALLHLAAVTICNSGTALDAFYRPLSSRIGKQKAVTATARTIAVLFYNAIRHGMTYHDHGAAGIG